MKSGRIDFIVVLVCFLVVAVAGSNSALARNQGKQTKADVELNRKIVHSSSASSNLGALHAKNQITCSGCHGKGIRHKGDTVENERCIACHGNYEALANETRPAQFPDRNPHQSHLGEIGCTVCHKAHAPSAVYCLNCHRKFNMKITGDSKQ